MIYLLLMTGVGAIVFHRRLGNWTVKYWECYGIHYRTRIVQIGFLLWGIGAIVFSLLHLLGYIAPQGGSGI